MAQRDDKIKELTANATGAQADLTQTQNNLKKEKDDRKKDSNAFVADLQNKNAEFEKEAQKLREGMKSIQEQVQALQLQRDNVLEQLADVQKAHAKQMAQLTNDNKELVKNEEKLRRQLEAFQNPKVEQFQVQDTPRGRILQMDPTRVLPTIDIGATHNVKPNLTFSIVGQGLDGRPTREVKGSLEVIRVYDNYSQARITNERDRDHNPIRKGDFLFNPSWSPSQQQHVAIAGLIDLDGDGRDDLPEFMRQLARQGIVVDAHLDPKEGKVKGEIQRTTDYLVLGDMPEVTQGALRTEDPRTKERMNLADQMNEMQKEAVKKAVPIISMRRFMALTGIQPPRGTQRPTVTGAGTPIGAPQDRKELEKKDQPKNGEKEERE
jgi:hypothetical protein